MISATGSAGTVGDLFWIAIGLGCVFMFVWNEIKFRESNRKFEKRLRNLGFSPDGTRLQDADEILAHNNQEIRSAFIEKWDGKGLRKIDSSAEGELFETEDKKRVVKVINSTPEPDGTNKVYWLRVPTHIETAKEAVAWTFGINKDEYNPIVES